MISPQFSQPRLQSSQRSFTHVPPPEIPRSVFDRSHGLKTAIYGGYLYPIYIDEALPGDTFRMETTTFGRVSTPIVPIMDNVHVDTFFFSVPFRLVWEHWEEFNGAQANPTSSTSYSIPQLISGDGDPTPVPTVESLWDYMGLPPGLPDFSVSALPFRAYNLIWNEWFRDQNLQDSVAVPLTDTPETYHPTLGNYVLQKRGKRKDYFTSALPEPQKGPDIPIPLGFSAPVYGVPLTGTGFGDTTLNNMTVFQGFGGSPGRSFTQLDRRDDAASRAVSGNVTHKNMGTGVYRGLSLGTPSDYEDFNTAFGPDFTGTPPYASLIDATAASINVFRQAFQMQRLFERDARGGTRYTEVIRAHFGVVSPDARLQRPEFLGGSSTRINFAPIPQTSATTDDVTPQGNLAAVAAFSHDGQRGAWTKSFTEHEIIIGLCSVRADLNYQQGVNRMWKRETRYDFYWPVFSHLGEQSIYNYEIYAQGSTGGLEDVQTFGFQERHAEYRYKPNIITGKMRSNVTGSLDVWHLAQDFEALPELDRLFIEDTPPFDRMVAVKTEPYFIVDVAFKLHCARPMPFISVPGMIDHF